MVVSATKSSWTAGNPDSNRFGEWPFDSNPDVHDLLRPPFRRDCKNVWAVVTCSGESKRAELRLYGGGHGRVGKWLNATPVLCGNCRDVLEESRARATGLIEIGRERHRALAHRRGSSSEYPVGGPGASLDSAQCDKRTIGGGLTPPAAATLARSGPASKATLTPGFARERRSARPRSPDRALPTRRLARATSRCAPRTNTRTHERACRWGGRRYGDRRRRDAA